MDVRKQLIKLLYKPFLQHKIDKLSDTGDIADHLIDHGVTVQEWISVKDGLPEDWTDVLILSRFGFLETAVYTGAPGKWRVGWNGDMLEANSITHWMPLPNPPKGE